MNQPDPDLVRAVEERSFNAWPSLETHLVDGWIVRMAEGYTKRANSLNAWMPSAPIDTVIDRAEMLLRSRSLPTVVRLSPLAGPDADRRLHDRGFTRHDETIVMTAGLTRDLPSSDSVGQTTIIDAHPLATWCAGFAAANNLPEPRRDIHDRMLANIRPPAAFATLANATGELAYGIAVVDRGWIGLFDIVTKPEARRRGAAAALVNGLLAWGRKEGAARAYLQVVATNTPAISLYQKLGFEEAYRYHYRISG